ncbi:hypothetical protein BIW11_09378 [Tropilaelaps mercedesae]|uniref:Uncharacterized protein n=1 Tax=Tropilaelaps mercedesae TaxID=418985 RepID=A0A1V9XKL1_9ACAR|nr:hypothetical protein BIW11_09378 [Tropilaelaps mercedesae]
MMESALGAKQEPKEPYIPVMILVILVLGLVIIILSIIDIYLLFKLEPVFDSAGSTPQVPVNITYEPTDLFIDEASHKDLIMDNWCDFTAEPIMEPLYKVVFNTSLISPLLKEPEKFSVVLTLKFFAWVPFLHSLANRFYIEPMVIFPYVLPLRAYVFDFHNYETQKQTLHKVDIGEPEWKNIPDAFITIKQLADIAAKVSETEAYGVFDLDMMNNGTTEFRTFHASFSVDFSFSDINITTCRNNTCCKHQAYESIIIGPLPELTTAAYVGLSVDLSQSTGYTLQPLYWANFSQALCCETNSQQPSRSSRPDSYDDRNGPFFEQIEVPEAPANAVNNSERWPCVYTPHCPSIIYHNGQIIYITLPLFVHGKGCGLLSFKRNRRNNRLQSHPVLYDRHSQPCTASAEYVK